MVLPKELYESMNRTRVGLKGMREKTERERERACSVFNLVCLIFRSSCHAHRQRSRLTQLDPPKGFQPLRQRASLQEHRWLQDPL